MSVARRGCRRRIGAWGNCRTRMVAAHRRTHMRSPDDVKARRNAFRRMHESGCFVIPNPWDIGSARYLKQLGFKALATTSSGAAWRQGRADGQMNVEDVL